MKQSVTVLGSTGSIGVNTLDVVTRHPDRFEVFALSAATRVDLMLEQCLQFRPVHAVMAHEASARALEQRLAQAGSATRVLMGADALERIAQLDHVVAIKASSGTPAKYAELHDRMADKLALLPAVSRNVPPFRPSALAAKLIPLRSVWPAKMV